MFTIRTTHTSNPSGRSQIVAKGAGRQRTVSFQHAHSNDWNHGTAAGTLLLALGHTDPAGITHEVIDSDHHSFYIP